MSFANDVLEYEQLAGDLAMLVSGHWVGLLVRHVCDA